MMGFQIQRYNRPMPSTHEPAAVRHFPHLAAANSQAARRRRDASSKLATISAVRPAPIKPISARYLLATTPINLASISTPAKAPCNPTACPCQQRLLRLPTSVGVRPQQPSKEADLKPISTPATLLPDLAINAQAACQHLHPAKSHPATSSSPSITPISSHDGPRCNRP
ncbi:hypothetical protein ACLOJK_039588 [Asimina triloba]